MWCLDKLLRIPVWYNRNNQYDYYTHKIMRRALRPDSNIVDVGCHKGSFINYAAWLAPKGRHFGIEPLPDKFAYLQNNVFPNCTVINKAASFESGTTVFQHVVSNPAYSGIRRRKYDKPNENVQAIEVQTARMDEMIPENLRVDFIKIDVEGAELWVLRGATRILSQYQPLVVFEHGVGAAEFYEYGPDEIYQFFESQSYAIGMLKDLSAGHERALSPEEFKSAFFSGHYYFTAFPKSE